MKLALGTVQFGLSYGVTNTQGQVSLTGVRAIMEEAALSKVQWLDTAAEYGSSEAVLGQLAAGKQFRICTKTCALPEENIDAMSIAKVRDGFRRSLTRLGQDHVDLLMVHHGRDVLKPGGALLYAELQKLQDEGLVNAIGFSAYTDDEIKQILSRYQFNALQVPVNILDQRLVLNGCLQECAAKGLLVFARSVFLQGRLLVRGPSASLPPDLQRYWDYIDESQLSPRDVTLGYIKSLECISYAVIGVTSRQEFCENIHAYQSADAVTAAELASHDPNLLDPRRWT